ncbi:MAG: sugar phosphate isomerase/epimerase [Oscillospiraceae bacterium]|nr:sugar phosphate isomerase/epimerase [Oscillospiraceae bacterium]
MAEKNIKYSFMNHWKTLPYKEIPNFRDFYYEDKTNYAYYQSWEQILNYTLGCGFEGIEIWPMAAPYIETFGSLKDFKDYVNSKGLGISGSFCGMGPGHIKENIPACVESVKKTVDLVAAVGGRHLNICPGVNYGEGGGPLTEDGIRNTIDCLNEMGRYAEDHGVLMGIHNEFFCIMNKDNHKRIIEATDPKYVHYCLDTAQVSIIGEDLCTFYDDYHDRIVTFHLKDTASPKMPDEVRYAASNPEIQDDGWRWFWEPGLGVLDFPGLFKLMKKHGFKGWATVETDGSPDLLASMAHSSYYIHTVLDKIYR